MNQLSLHTAYKKGDLEALKYCLGYPADFPNNSPPPGWDSTCLDYAIYHSPLPFVGLLLELGADPNYEEGSYPSLLAALSSAREDRYALLELLLEYGADIHQRGINDYTPLHYAANLDDAQAIPILLAHGADRDARTNVDEYATPLEEAQNLGRRKAAAALRLENP